ncbi:uncharacterized protein [Leptinotarsa decemlineata]|uniref:uncharacterized protein n=1 Tax=Leptinotarsa decemlineata TaxID=7539 RepID=UPI003D30C075
MSIREKLRIAYENVAYSADKTWKTEYSNLWKSNMDLLMMENQLQEPKPVELRPRTVRDCIPQSKLARYSNYEYNDSRELSYTMEDLKVSNDFSDEFFDEPNKEPWMLEEVNDYYKFYTDKIENKDNQQNPRVFTLYESPFLKSNSLSEYFLKYQISKDEVKKIWDAKNVKSKSFMFRSLQSIRGEKSFIVYKSPAGHVFVSDSDDVTSYLKEDYYEWFKDEFDYKNNVDHLNLLSNSFKEQIKNDCHSADHILDTHTDSAQSRRLYSAVLQGYSSKNITHEPTEGQMTILKRNISPDKNVMEKLGSVNSDMNKNSLPNSFKYYGEVSTRNSSMCSESSPQLFPNHSPFVNSRSVQTTSTTSNVGVSGNLFTISNGLQCENNFNEKKMSQNCFTPGSTRYRPNYPSTSYHQHPSFYMFIQNNVSQNFLQPVYTPVTPVMLHRTVPQTFERSFPQRTFQVPVSSQYNIIHASNFVTQNKHSPNIQRFDRQPFKSKSREKSNKLEKKKAVRSGGAFGCNIKKTNDNTSCSSLISQSTVSASEEDNDIDLLVSRTIDLVLDESRSENMVPICGSHSDELERQALEQYNNSSDNVFQELERQAAEEYEFCSENCNSPPNLHFLFGGFLNGYKFCFI